MKKSSDNQSINDLYPLAFKSLDEPIPLASPSFSPTTEGQPEGVQVVENSSGKADPPREARSHPRSTRAASVSILPILMKQWEASRPPTQRKRIKRLSENIKAILDLDAPPANLHALINSLPIPKSEKATLIKFLEGRLEPGSKAYWRLEHQFLEVQKHLVGINDKSPNEAIQQYLNLITQRMYLRRTGEGKTCILCKYRNAKTPLPRTGSGRREMLLEEKEEIIADCKKWRPICEGLNKAFKELWQQSEYESLLYRKEARGLLAEKYGISVKEVKAIERVLKTPSRRSNKSTPTEAMLQMVALDHVGRDVKTIEKIWEEYLKEHPEESRKKRNFLPP